ncbi:MAG: TolB family protein, partial [Anaerolineae bacterium]
ENFPTVVYLVQRLRPPADKWSAPLPQHPLQIWKLHYEAGMLREELLADLQPEVLAAQGIPEAIGYARALHLLPAPDGKMLALSVEAGYPPAAVLIVTTEGTVVWHSTLECPAMDVFGWAPDSAEVLALVHGCSLVSIDEEGCRPVGACEGGAISPDGRYVFYTYAPIRLSRFDVNTGATVVLVREKFRPELIYARTFVWSPDGKQAVLVWDKLVQVRYGEGQLWLMDADGSNLRPLGRDDTYDFYPAWSPDGKTIAFARRENPPEDLAPIFDPTALVSSLYLLDAESGNERLLLSSEGKFAHWDPEWLPDGSGLVFLSDRGGEANLYFIRSDGTGLQQLTRQGGLTGEIAVLKPQEGGK